MIKYISILFIVIFAASSVFAQNKTNNKEVRVVSKYKSELPDADKLVKYPILADTARTRVNFSYSLNPHPEFSNIDLFSDDAPRLKGEPLQDLDGGYFKLGAGNYSTWMGEFAFNNKRSKKYDWGLYLYNYNSTGKVEVDDIGKRKTGLGNTRSHIYGKRFFDNSVASVSLNYNIDRLRYYGLAPSIIGSGLKQKFSDFNIDLSYASKYDSEINYEARLSYSNFKDKYLGWKEDLIVAGLGLETEMLGNSFTADVSIEHLSQNTWSDYTCFYLRPSYSIKTGRFLIDLGFGISLKTGEDTDVYIHPVTTVKYAVVKDVLSLYAFAKGGTKNNTYRNVSKENPFTLVGVTWFSRDYNNYGNSTIISNENKTTHTKYDIGAGLKGQFARFVSFNISASYKQVDNYVFYSNGGATFMEFYPSYDNAKIFNIKAELNADIDEQVNISSTLNYYNYSMEKLDQPFHKPEAELHIKANYKYSSNLKFGASLKYVGERYASEIFKLDSYMLMDLDAEYKFSDYVYSFVKINNLFNTDYQKWQGYPNYGISLMVGMSFSF